MRCTLSAVLLGVLLAGPVAWNPAGPALAGGKSPAGPVFDAEGAFRAVEARGLSPDVAAWGREVLRAEFPFSRAEALAELRRAHPSVEPGRLEAWLDGGAEYVLLEGERRYFVSLAENFGFRNLDVLRREEGAKGNRGEALVERLRDLAFRVPRSGFPDEPFQPLTRPVTYLGTQTLRIARSDLPREGTLRLWFPLPILTGDQDQVRLISVTPERWVRGTPWPEEDLGQLHMEIPLKELSGDLDLRILFTFRHWERRSRVDPDRVGAYDRESDLYRRYTAPGLHTPLTPEIVARARAVVGDESNPWRAARRIYDHLLATLSYSFTPHLVLGFARSPEAVYVLRNGYGDCGAQSMLFSALCRAVGIPARTTGGYQLVPGLEGTHFWAEFYLPAYGWIPVDVTLAGAADWGELPDRTRRAFRDYCFGNLDPYRLVIQRDVDIPLRPRPAAPAPLMPPGGAPIAFQSPAATLETLPMTDLRERIEEGWRQEILPLDR